MGGGGGGRRGCAYLKNRDQLIDVGIIRYATSEDTLGGVLSVRIIKLESGHF